MKRGMSLFLLGLALVMSIFNSCTKDPAAPTAVIYATIDGYQVTFTPTVTGASTYAWDFGDGTGTSTEAAPVYTYESFGEYTVSLTVTGDGGSVNVTKVITIEATSIKDILTGGAANVNGKTWVMSTAYTPGQDGGGPITAEMPVLLPSAENVLDLFGLGAEYDNEYTFYFDGSYKMNLKNGNGLAGAVYGAVTQTMVGDPAYDIGMCAATYTPPTDATWTLHTEDLVVDAIADPNTTDVPPVHGNVTFTGKNWISFSEGAYFGILDFPTTAKFIIKSISTNQMQVAMFLCGYGYGDNLDNMMLPTNFIHITFVPKAAK